MRGWIKATVKWGLIFLLIVGVVPMGAKAKTNTIEVIENNGSLYDEKISAKSYDLLALENLNLLMNDSWLNMFCSEEIGDLFSNEDTATPTEEPSPAPSISPTNSGNEEALEMPTHSPAATSLASEEPAAPTTSVVIEEEEDEITPSPSPYPSAVQSHDQKKNSDNVINQEEGAEGGTKTATVSDFVCIYDKEIAGVNGKTLGELVNELEIAIEEDYIYGSVLPNVRVFDIKSQISVYLQALLESGQLDKNQIKQAKAALVYFEEADQLACQHASAILCFSAARVGGGETELQAAGAAEAYKKGQDFCNNNENIFGIQSYVSSYGLLLQGLNALDITLDKSLFECTADTDGDGLCDGTEFLDKMNPYSKDTDNDGLSDSLERLFYPCYSPIKADTDDDGVSDFYEDMDKDGLKNSEEQEYGTEIILVDSDGDHLEDGFEVNSFGSDPMKYDSDGDTLSDADEYILGTDPNIKDSDADGIPDNQETYAQHMSKSIDDKQAPGVISVGVSFEGNGNIESTTEIYCINQIEQADAKALGMIGIPIHIETRSTFETATIEFTYDESKLGADEDELAIVWYDVANKEYVLLDSTVDTINNTVSVETTHFSTYFLYDSSADNGLANMPLIKAGLNRTKVEVIFTLDSSDAMGRQDPEGIRKTCACAFVDALSSEDYVGLVDYDMWGGPQVGIGLTHDFDAVKRVINSLNSFGTTNLYGNMLLSRGAINQAHDFGRITETDNKKAIIMLKGAGGIYPHQYMFQKLRNEAVLARNYGIVYYTISLHDGKAGDRARMKEYATITDGLYFEAQTAEELIPIFEMILYDLIGSGYTAPIDIDGDGVYEGGAGYDDLFWELYGEDYLNGDLSEALRERLLGLREECASGFEPINFNTGGFFIQTQDAAFSAMPDTLGSITRTYNTLTQEENGPFGKGWVFGYNMHMKFYDSGDVGIINPDGHLSLFYKNSDGIYQDELADQQSLTRENGEYIVTNHDNSQYIFKSNGLLDRIVSAGGNTDTVFYNDQGLIVSIALSSGEEILLTSSDDGHITEITLPGGSTLAYAYEENLLTSYVDAAGGETRYVYDEKGRMVEWYDTAGARQVKNVYDDEDRVIQQWDAVEGYYELAYYDGYTVTTNAEGVENTFYYDELGRSTKLTDSDGYSQSFEYNDFNLVTKYTDQAGNETAYVYDEKGNLTKEMTPDGRTRAFTYDSNSNLIGQSDYQDNWTAFEYDENGNVIRLVQPDGSEYTFTYNENNQLLKEAGPLGYEVSYTYDGSNLIEITDANGEKTKNEYDDSGNLVRTIDSEGNATEFLYDGLSQVVATTLADDTALKFEYDEAGNISAVYDAYSVATTYAYDSLGQLTEETNPDDTETLYEYDKNGNLTKITEPNGRTTVNTYDDKNNLITTKISTGQSYQYYYNSTGDMVGMLDETTDAFYYFGYDRISGRLIYSVDTEGGRTEYTYDANNNVAKVVYADESYVTYEYDDMNRVTTQILANGATTVYGYDALGRMVAATDANGNTTTYTYDLNDNLTEIKDALGNITLYEYDAVGNLTRSVDANGNATAYRYDAVGQINKIVYPLGGTERIGYDANGQITKIVDALGGSTTSTYDVMGRVTSAKDVLGGTATYTYDIMGNLTQQTNAVDEKVTYAYDTMGNLTEIEDELGDTVSYAYDSQGNLTAITGEEGFKQIYTYDKMGRITTILDSEGYKTTYAYDKMGRVVTESDNMGKSLTYTYDKMGQVKSVTNAKHETTRFSYDKGGNIIQITYADDTIEKFTYDALYRVVTATDQEGQITRYFYDAVGNVTAVLQPGEIKTAYEYDAENNLICETAPDGSETTYRYDAAGNLTRMTDALGNETKLVYNEAGLLTRVENAAGDTILKVKYDVLGNITSETDAEGNVTSYAYDAKNRLTSVTDPMGETTRYVYDAADNLVGMIDANENQTTYTYNTLGALTSETDALGNTEAYSYKKDGLLAEIIKPDGTSQSYTYDAIGRMIRIDYSDGGQTTYGHNPLGAVTTMTGAEGTSTYQYDDSGRLASYIDANGRTVSYAYDDLGRRTKTTLPDGQVTAYVYDNMNRITEVQNADSTVAEYTYNAVGQLVENAREGLLTTYEYDELGQIENLVTYKAERLLESYRYTYDDNGNILSERRETEADTTHRTYTYDANQRLTEMSQENHSEAYTYDAVGNITQKTMNGETTAYTYNTANQLVTETQGAKTIEYIHNQNGDLIAKSSGESYTYDVRGHLTGISGNGTRQQFTYDGAGNRLSKTVDGKTTEYLNDINLPYTQVLQTFGEDGQTQNTYTYGVQRIKSEGEISETYLYDGRGSVSGVLGDKGSISTYAYTAYGDLLPDSPTPNAFGYNAEDTDYDTGLQFLRARYYNTKIGRFTEKDEYKGDFTQPSTLNRYAYCAGNPVNRMDPSGYSYIDDQIADIDTQINEIEELIESSTELMRENSELRDEYQTKLNQFTTCLEQAKMDYDDAFWSWKKNDAKDRIDALTILVGIYTKLVKSRETMKKGYESSIILAEQRIETLESNKEILLSQYSPSLDDNNKPTLSEEDVIKLLDFALSEAEMSAIENSTGESPDGNRRVESGKDTDDTMYNEWKDMVGYDWCGYFVQYVIKNSIGYSDTFKPQSSTGKYNSNVSESVKQDSIDGYKPISGDIFYFFTDKDDNGVRDDGTRSHIGLVLGRDEEFMYTIEGNIHGMITLVKRRYKDVEDLHFIMNNSGYNNVIDYNPSDFELR